MLVMIVIMYLMLKLASFIFGLLSVAIGKKVIPQNLPIINMPRTIIRKNTPIRLTGNVQTTKKNSKKDIQPFSSKMTINQYDSEGHNDPNVDYREGQADFFKDYYKHFHQMVKNVDFSKDYSKPQSQEDELKTLPLKMEQNWEMKLQNIRGFHYQINDYLKNSESCDCVDKGELCVCPYSKNGFILPIYMPQVIVDNITSQTVDNGVFNTNKTVNYTSNLLRSDVPNMINDVKYSKNIDTTQNDVHLEKNYPQLHRTQSRQKNITKLQQQANYNQSKIQVEQQNQEQDNLKILQKESLDQQNQTDLLDDYEAIQKKKEILQKKLSLLSKLQESMQNLSPLDRFKQVPNTEVSQKFKNTEVISENTKNLLKLKDNSTLGKQNFFLNYRRKIMGIPHFGNLDTDQNPDNYARPDEFMYDILKSDLQLLPIKIQVIDAEQKEIPEQPNVIPEEMDIPVKEKKKKYTEKVCKLGFKKKSQQPQYDSDGLLLRNNKRKKRR